VERDGVTFVTFGFVSVYINRHELPGRVVSREYTLIARLLCWLGFFFSVRALHR